MSNKDKNIYLKHLKSEIKAKEQRDKSSFKINRYMTTDRSQYNNGYEQKHNEICKEASEMSAREQLMNYAVTGDPTYIGVGCNWDLLSRLGMKKKGLF
jgi:hypothetical protein